MPACKEYTSKRYSAPRRVPPYIAADCRGDVMQGTTGGKMYKSVQNKTQWRWNNVENLKKKTQRKSRAATSKKSAAPKKSRKSRKSRTPGHSPRSAQELNAFFANLEKSSSPGPGRKSRKSRKTRRISNSNN